ncbi:MULTISPECIES: hypothetical protein [Pseudomonas]|uniref:hypothetical protein n=1 Tax=Pseudomonas TaxID=286 RepID=UPI001EFFD082|nr:MULTISPECIES: hypothetical protein [Pseudomonas]MCG8293156.1 hypothetical protein [Pseudomonas entomophila]
MALRILMIGASGNFGRIISQHLNQMPDVPLVIAGRIAASMQALVAVAAAPTSGCTVGGCGWRVPVLPGCS